MAIPYEDSIKRTTAQPRFTDEVFADLTIRDAFASTLRYEGMTCYVVDTELYYYLRGGIDNANWAELGSGGSGSGIEAAPDLTARDAIDPLDRTIGMIVFVESNEVNYQLRGGITNADWKPLANHKIVSQAVIADGFQFNPPEGATSAHFKVTNIGGPFTSHANPFTTTRPVDGFIMTVTYLGGESITIAGSTSGTDKVRGPDLNLGPFETAEFVFLSDLWIIKSKSPAY